MHMLDLPLCASSTLQSFHYHELPQNMNTDLGYSIECDAKPSSPRASAVWGRVKYRLIYCICRTYQEFMRASSEKAASRDAEGDTSRISVGKMVVLVHRGTSCAGDIISRMVTWDG